MLSEELDSLETASVITGCRGVCEMYLQGYLDRPPKENLNLLARFIQREALSFSEQSVTCVVDDDIKTTEMVLGRRERSLDLFVVHDVELLYEQLLGGVFVFQVREDSRLAESRDDPFAVGKDSFDEGPAETG